MDGLPDGMFSGPGLILRTVDDSCKSQNKGVTLCVEEGLVLFCRVLKSIAKLEFNSHQNWTIESTVEDWCTF
jgi:hypothetical protein